MSQAALCSLPLNEVGPVAGATWTCTAQSPHVSALYASTVDTSACRNVIAEMSSSMDFDVTDGCTCEDDAALVCSYCRQLYQDGIIADERAEQFGMPSFGDSDHSDTEDDMPGMCTDSESDSDHSDMDDDMPGMCTGSASDF